MCGWCAAEGRATTTNVSCPKQHNKTHVFCVRLERPSHISFERLCVIPLLEELRRPRDITLTPSRRETLQCWIWSATFVYILRGCTVPAPHEKPQVGLSLTSFSGRARKHTYIRTWLKYVVFLFPSPDDAFRKGIRPPSGTLPHVRSPLLAIPILSALLDYECPPLRRSKNSFYFRPGQLVLNLGYGYSRLRAFLLLTFQCSLCWL